MVDVGMIALIAFAIYSMFTLDKEQCGREWTEPDFSGKYLPVISKQYVLHIVAAGQ